MVRRTDPSQGSRPLRFLMLLFGVVTVAGRASGGPAPTEVPARGMISSAVPQAGKPDGADARATTEAVEWARVREWSRSIGVDEAARRDLAERLRRPAQVAFDNTPWPGAVAEIGRQADFAWVVVPRDLAALRLDPKEAITLRPKAGSAKDRLAEVLDQLRLTAYPSRGFVEIADRSGLSPLTCRWHSIADLQIAATGPAFWTPAPEPGLQLRPFAAIQDPSELIVRIVDPDSWDTSGGDSSIHGDPALPGLLIVNTERNHERIEELFAALRLANLRARRLAAKPRLDSPAESIPLEVSEATRGRLEDWWQRSTVPAPSRFPIEAEHRPASRLRRSITLPDGPLVDRDLPAIIATQCGLRLIVEPNLLARMSAQRGPLVVRGRPGPDARWLLENVLEVAWREEGERLQLLAGDDRALFHAAAHDVRDLVDLAGGGEQRVWSGVEELMKSLHSDGFDEREAEEGRMRFDAARRTLDVTSSSSGHDAIRGGLDLIRAGIAAQAPKRDACGIPAFSPGWWRNGAPAPIIRRPALPPIGGDSKELTAPIPAARSDEGWVRALRHLARTGQSLPPARTRREFLDGFARFFGTAWSPERGTADDRWLDQPLPAHGPERFGSLAAFEEDASIRFGTDGGLRVDPGGARTLVWLIHPIADLLPADGADRMLERYAIELKEAIAPDSWDAGGGDGDLLPHRPTRSLVIHQTPEHHLAIQEFLNARRRP